MTNFTVAYLARIFAIQAQIEGMKVTNDERRINSYAPAYDEEAFGRMASELLDLAVMAQNAPMIIPFK